MDVFCSRSIYAEWLVSACAGRDISAAEIASVSGGAADLIQGTNLRLPFDDYLRLLNWAAEKCKDPWLGLHLGSEFDSRLFGIFGYLIRHSSTLRMLCEVSSKYMATISPCVALDFLPATRISRMEYRTVVPVQDVSRQDIDHTLASVATVFRMHLGAAWQPRTVSFSYSAPVDTSVPQQFFGGDLRFDQPRNFIEFDSAILNTNISDADPNLMAVLLPQANQMMEKLIAHPSLSNQVRSLIMGELDSGQMDSEAVARRLNMSRASLCRKLRDEQTSFQVIRDGIIERLAKNALDHSDAPISQIALMLGYSEHSAFAHSFKRLVGISPSAYRNRQA